MYVGEMHDTDEESCSSTSGNEDLHEFQDFMPKDCYTGQICMHVKKNIVDSI